jgi:hypothetical protein
MASYYFNFIVMYDFPQIADCLFAELKPIGGVGLESSRGLISFGRGGVYSDLTQSSEIVPFRTTDRERNHRADNPLGV